MNGSGSKPRLYELAFADGRSASPYVWRVRYALAHKGIPFESVPLGFTDMPRVFGGRFKTVPVIEHGETMLSESWDIVDYLEREFPGAPPLFSGPAERAMVRLTDAWVSAEILSKLIRIYVLDIYHAVRSEDRAYFRQSREQRFKGVALETIVADRTTQLGVARGSLQPLRSQLERFPFLGGSAPNYADYIGFGVFQWVASMSTLPLLSQEDAALRAWLDRGFDLYGGLGREPKMRALFE